MNPENKIFIADSGSTKTDWSFLSKEGERGHCQTKGYNPYYQSTESILESLRNEWPDAMPHQPIQTIYFYGSGCATIERAATVEKALRQFFDVDKVEVNSDLLGAARALCGDSAGIACILGTGSGSCAFDGKHISGRIPSLGFILGDEGSGAYLGKILITDFLRGKMPVETQKKLLETYSIDKETVLETINKNEMPSRYLATFAKFIGEQQDDHYVFDIAYRGFRAFADNYIIRYKDFDKMDVHFVGSVAYYNKKALCKLSEDLSFNIGNIYKAPMEGLIKYHTQNL